MKKELDARDLTIDPNTPSAYLEEEMPLIVLDVNVGLFKHNPIIAELIKFEKMFIKQIKDEEVINWDEKSS